MKDRPTELDEVDREILFHLQTDARNTTNAELSELVGVSATTIGQRLSDLEAQNVIKTYDTMVDYERAGFPHRILLFCTVHPDDRHGAVDTLLNQRGVVSVRELISGQRNLHVEIVGRSRDEIVATIAAIENVGVTVESSELIKQESREPFDQFAPDTTE